MGYRREALVLALVAAAMLVSLYPLNTQDVTRLSLSVSLVQRGTVDVDPFHTLMLDRAYRDGHWYSDKAPGMSVLAIPADQLFRAIDSARGGAPLPVWRREGQLWAIRVLTGGVALLAATFLVGRAAEGLARGYGAVTAATFALGTIAGPLGPTLTGHVAAGALAFGGFLAAGRRSRALPLAGFLAGAAVLFEYQAALLALVVACYATWRRGPRGLALVLAGAAPAAIALGAYNEAAFGSPLHFSYRYVANRFAELQHEGFFGLGVPSAHGLWLALLDGRGLLVVSPVGAAAAAGLLLAYRRGLRAEALACGAAAALFVVLDAAYFDPYGGDSPGPRFLAAALPFLALGLPDAFRRLPAPTAALALASVAAVTLDTFTWEGVSVLHPAELRKTIWSRAGAPREAGMALVVAAVAAAVAVAAAGVVRQRRAEAR